MSGTSSSTPDAVVGPRLHELAPLLEQVAAPIGGLDGTADSMCERHFHNMIRILGYFSCPIPEGRSKPMHGNVAPAHAAKELAWPIVCYLTSFAREDVLTITRHRF